MVQPESIQEGAEDKRTHERRKRFPSGWQRPPVQAASIHEADPRARVAPIPRPSNYRQASGL